MPLFLLADARAGRVSEQGLFALRELVPVRGFLVDQISVRARWRLAENAVTQVFYLAA